MINFLNKCNMLQCEDLSTHCTMRVGGKAKYYVEPLTTSQLVEIVKQCNKLKIKYFILGNGSNVIFKDKGFDGVVICTKIIMDMREKHIHYNRYLELRAILFLLVSFFCHKNMHLQKSVQLLGCISVSPSFFLFYSKFCSDCISLQSF